MAQISLTFPDGNKRVYDAGVTPAEVAASIAPSLAKAAISAQVNGKHWDLAWPIPSDATISLNTLKDEGPALELIRQIQRLTEEIDRLEAQVRALAGLAELSRISVQLVPREALAWQGPEAETAEMAWIRQLSPLRTEAPVVVKKLELAVPEGLVRLDEQGPYVAESPDGARIWAWRTENTPEGDAAFWLEAMKGRLGRDFARADAEVIGGFKVLRLVDRTEQPYTWMVAVRVEGRWLHVVQVFTPTPEATGRHEAAIRAVLLGGEA